MWYKDFEIEMENVSANSIYRVIDHLPDGREDVTHYATFALAARYAIDRARLRDEFEAMKEADGLHVTRFSANPERWREGRQYACQVARTAWTHVMQSTALEYGRDFQSVISSWGVSKKHFLRWRNMPALALHVEGFEHTGWVIISLNEGADTYEVELADEHFYAVDGSRHEDVYNDSLGELIDRLVERGTCSKAEYDAKIKAACPIECWAMEHGAQVVYL